VVIAQLIPAEVSDIPKIQQLAAEIWYEHYPAIIGVEQVAYMLNKNYSTASLQQQVGQGQQFYYIEWQQEQVGFMSVSTSQKEGFIHKFYILSEHHGKQVGSEAFLSLCDMLPQITSWKLQVNRQNFKAINFYFKCGFYISEVADFDIGDGYFMNDFIMTWERDNKDSMT
jgi:GNAT superfamily N-acetyltransferase